jgi:hypothetical protein
MCDRAKDVTRSTRARGPPVPPAPRCGKQSHDAAARAGTLRRHMSEELDFDPIAEARRQWDEHWGQDAGPSMVAVASIMRAYQVLLNRLNELLAPWELTFPQYEAWMLLFYSRRGSLPLGKMGTRLIGTRLQSWNDSRPSRRRCAGDVGGRDRAADELDGRRRPLTAVILASATSRDQPHVTRRQRRRRA